VPSPTAITVRTIGAGAQLELPEETLRVIAELGIGENTVSLWARMGITDKVAAQAGKVAFRNNTLLT